MISALLSASVCLCFQFIFAGALFGALLAVASRMQPIANVSLRSDICAVCLFFRVGCRLWRKAWPFAARSGKWHIVSVLLRHDLRAVKRKRVFVPSLLLLLVHFPGLDWLLLRVCSRLAMWF